jgi:hypothetical protein
LRQIGLGPEALRGSVQQALGERDLHPQGCPVLP